MPKTFIEVALVANKCIVFDNTTNRDKFIEVFGNENICVDNIFTGLRHSWLDMPYEAPKGEDA